MKEHALIKLLKSFSKNEIRDFGEFISNTYFNKRKAVEKLYSIVKKYYPLFDNKDLNTRIIFGKVFPGKIYNESSMRVLLHYLYELSKKFLAVRSFENNNLEYDMAVRSELFRRKQTDNWEKAVDKSLNNLKPGDYFSEMYYYNKYRLEYDKLYFLAESSSGVFEKLIDKFDFQKIFYDFNIYYNLKAMRFYLVILNLEIIYKREFRKDHFEKVISGIDLSEYKDIAIVKIYYFLIKILTSADKEKFYFKTKELLLQTKQTLNVEDLSEIYINMKNYCKRKIAEGNGFYIKEEFEIIREEIDSKSYLINGEMPPVFYRNTVNTSLMLKNFEWVKDFIYDSKGELPEKSRNDAFHYCLALYEFGTGNYGKSLELIAKIRYEETYQKVESKILQMMIYFETNAVESLYSSMEAFRQFLSNDKVIPENRKLPYANFYKTFSRMISLNNKKDKYELMKFKTNLLAQKRVSYKEWLVEKTDNILNSMQTKKIRKLA